MDFIAIDVETANADMASICQIGIAKFSKGQLIDEWSTLVNPEDYFHAINIGIHGITQDDVLGYPKLPDIHHELLNQLSETICVSHTHFDRISINRAFEKYDLPQIETTWLDSAGVARRAWEDCAKSGYGLANVCAKIGFEFSHHDALEDAKACGHVLLAAIETTGLDTQAWLKRVKQPINPSRSSSSSGGSKVSMDGNPEGELYGEVMVFTGALEIPRREAAELAASIGCTIASNVNKQTTLLVVGDQDISQLAGKEKSSKHIKAEQLIAKGQPIRIICESDFMELAKS